VRVSTQQDLIYVFINIETHSTIDERENTIPQRSKHACRENTEEPRLQRSQRSVANTNVTS